MTSPATPTDIVGYRCWRVGLDERGPALFSAITNQSWPEPVVGPADIDAEGGPWTTHKQGYYAFSSPLSLLHLGTGGLVSGGARLWGRVAVHESGFRAEWAQVLWLSEDIRCLLCHRLGELVISVNRLGPAHVTCSLHRGRRTGHSVRDFLHEVGRRYEVDVQNPWLAA
jgi:hypothetical protein